MKVIAQQLKLKNFKGIKSLEVKFDPHELNIRGANATGKTTIMDAFLWVLFGRDSEDRTDFSVKTLGPDGLPIHYLDHEVELTLLVDDQKITFRKVLNEKWTKPRGKAEAEFQGHETTYFIGGVPVTMREYNTKVSSLCVPTLFKMLTNPLHFPLMKWEDQRKILFEMAGAIDDNDLELTPAMKAMLRAKGDQTVEWYNREISASKRKIKDELDTIPARIDEINRNTPDRSNWKQIEEEIAIREQKLKEIESAKLDKSKELEIQAKEIRNTQAWINTHKTRRQAIEFEVRYKATKDIEEAKADLRRARDTIALHEKDLADINNRQDKLAKKMAELVSQLESLRAEWKKINAETFIMNENSMICPTCKRVLDDDDIFTKRREMEADFNQHKSKRLSDNVASGKSLSAEIEELKKEQFANEGKASGISEEINRLRKEIPELEARIPKDEPDVSAILASHEEYNNLATTIAVLEKQIEDSKTRTTAREYDIESEPIRREIEELKARYADKAVIEKMDARYKELVDLQKKLASDLASLEKEEAVIYDYNKLRANATEEKVSSLFKLVRFKLFDTQVNGQEVPTCEATVNGVPWRDLNSAMKVSSGIDIINALNKHYAMSFPVWIDNREGISEIPPIKSQLVNLYVDPSCKTLLIA